MILDLAFRHPHSKSYSYSSSWRWWILLLSWIALDFVHGRLSYLDFFIITFYSFYRFISLLPDQSFHFHISECWKCAIRLPKSQQRQPILAEYTEDFTKPYKLPSFSSINQFMLCWRFAKHWSLRDLKWMDWAFSTGWWGDFALSPLEQFFGSRLAERW